MPWSNDRRGSPNPEAVVPKPVPKNWAPYTPALAHKKRALRPALDVLKLISPDQAEPTAT